MKQELEDGDVSAWLPLETSTRLSCSLPRSIFQTFFSEYLYRPHLCLLGAESKLTGMTSFEVLYDPMSNLR